MDDKKVLGFFGSKRAKSALKYTLPAVFVFSLILMGYFVFADPPGSGLINFALTPTTFNFDEDLSFRYNVTINNTNSEMNITQVNVSFANFTYFFGTDGANSGADFVNTSNVLSWTNDSAVDGLINFGQLKNFWFNLTAVEPGNYSLNLTVLFNDGSVNVSSVNVSINDKTAPTVNINSPIEFGNYSGEMLLNVSASDISGISTVGFIILNDSWITLTASQYGNGWNASFNSASLIDNYYHLQASVYDGAGNSKTVDVFNFKTDNTYPVISFNGSTAVNYANLSQNWIYVNVSVNETNFKNVTFSLAYENGTSVNVSAFSDSTRVINWTNLSDGRYNYTVYVSDYSGNTNFSEMRRMILDNAAPSMDLTDSDATRTSITLDYGEEDALSGIASCSITDDDGGSTTDNVVSDLSCGTEYTFEATCVDYAGNEETDSETFSTDDCASNNGDNGRGSNSGSVVSKWVKEIKVNETEMKLGQVLKQVKKNYRLTFKVKGLGHSVGVINITNRTATIEVASTPQTATLTIGESKKFNLDSDRYYELLISLSSISNGNANISVQIINESISLTTSGDQNNTITNRSEESLAQPPATQQPSAQDEKKKGYGAVFWIAISLVVIGLIVIILKNSGKGRYAIAAHHHHHTH